MELERLPTGVTRALQSISGPARYLFPGPNRSSTGPLEESLLLIGPAQNGRSFTRPGFHRFYRMLKGLPDKYVEHFMHPKPDYFRMTDEQNVDPWALESRRPVFSFNTWVCPLSWPGDWIQLKTLLETIQANENYDPSTTVICTVPSSDFPLMDDISKHVDALVTGPVLPSTPQNLQNALAKIDSDSPNPVSFQDLESGGTSVLPHDHWPDALAPIPFHSARSPAQFWIGSITSYDQNHSLQYPSWPSFSLPSPSTVLKHVEDTINQQGLQHVTVGRIHPKQVDDLDVNRWQLEFLERFHSRWGQRPICYQLDNPRPDHPVWTYEHLIERYNHTSLHAHLGRPNPELLQDLESNVLDRWLHFFLSGGGPDMTFSIDVNVETMDPETVLELCRELQSVNQHFIDGKGQFQLELQPQFTKSPPWTSSEKMDAFLKEVRSSMAQNDTRITVKFPEFYEEMRSLHTSAR